MKEFLNHSCAVLLVILIPGCIWLGAVLVHAIKRSRKLKRQLGGKEKLIVEDYEMEGDWKVLHK